MNDRETEVQNLLSNAPQKTMAYADVYNSIAPENRIHLRRTLVSLKSQNLVTVKVSFDPDTKATSHTLTWAV